MIHALATALLLAVAPLTPQRLYYQVNRAMPVAVQAGESRELVLLKPDNSEVARAKVPDGATEVDVALLIPTLYSNTEVRYLQLLEGGAPTGPALLLEPLVERPKPVLRYGERGPQVDNWVRPSPEQLSMAGFRVSVDRDVVLHTTLGDIKLVMRPDMAPNTAWNFTSLVEGGFYTNIPFHRIIGNTPSGKGFVIQAGDPTGSGSGGPGYSIDLEPSTLPHDLGVISMAREGGNVDTGGSQFFICLSREMTERLDGQYTSFGQTLEGLDVIAKLGAVKTGMEDRPLSMPYIETAELVPAAPRTPGKVPSWMAKPQEPKTEPSAPANPQR